MTDRRTVAREVLGEQLAAMRDMLDDITRLRNRIVSEAPYGTDETIAVLETAGVEPALAKRVACAAGARYSIAGGDLGQAAFNMREAIRRVTEAEAALT